MPYTKEKFDVFYDCFKEYDTHTLQLMAREYGISTSEVGLVKRVAMWQAGERGPKIENAGKGSNEKKTTPDKKRKPREDTPKGRKSMGGKKSPDEKPALKKNDSFLGSASIKKASAGIAVIMALGATASMYII